MSLEHVISPSIGNEAHIMSQSNINHGDKVGPVSKWNPFLTGYIDCAQEALWFLTQVEKLPWDHPTVVGLQIHLWEQYKMLHLQQMLGDSLKVCNNEQENVIDEIQLDSQQNHVITNDGDKINSAIDEHSEDISENSAIRTETIINDDSKLSHSELKYNNNMNLDKKEPQLSPEAQTVAEALAEEIFHILNTDDNDLDFDSYTDEEDEEDDEEEDSENESKDEGFDEVLELSP
ncbi:hypothetical protein ACF0H5_007259 [Mactra antiquata]